MDFGTIMTKVYIQTAYLKLRAQFQDNLQIIITMEPYASIRNNIAKHPEHSQQVLSAHWNKFSQGVMPEQFILV